MAEPKENDPTPASGADPGAATEGPEGPTKSVKAPPGQPPETVGAAAPAVEPQGEQPAKPPRQGKQDKQPKKDKKGKQPAEGKERPAAEPEGPPPEPAPRPRLLEHYEQRVRAKLAQQFGLGNAHEVPKLVKIVLNVGMGDAPKNPKGLEAATAELAAITGQHPVVTRAKKAIANFNLREGMAIGCAVTLRGARMYEFLDRFITIAVPRMRDFRGLSPDSFDGRGNYTIGIKEQIDRKSTRLNSSHS